MPEYVQVPISAGGITAIMCFQLPECETAKAAMKEFMSRPEALALFYRVHTIINPESLTHFMMLSMESLEEINSRQAKLMEQIVLSNGDIESLSDSSDDILFMVNVMKNFHDRQVECVKDEYKERYESFCDEFYARLDKDCSIRGFVAASEGMEKTFRRYFPEIQLD